MKRTALFLLALAVALSVSAQSLPQLFMKAKEQVKSAAWADALKTLESVSAEAAKPGNESAQKQLEGPAAFYRAVCEANLDRPDQARADFAIFLKTQPNAGLDRSMYSKKAVDAFEAAKKESAPDATAAVDNSPSLFRAFQEFKPPANAVEPPNEKRADGPIKRIMTVDERREWGLASTGQERVDFIAKFWKSRNPNAGSEDNTYRTGFERRVAFADANFTQDEKVRGSMTDRGMVFVLLGPPTYAGRKPLRTGEDASDAAGLSTVGSQDEMNAQRTAAASSPSGKVSSAQQAAISSQYSGPGTRALDAANNWREVWHYRKELLPKSVRYQQVDFEFITKKGYGQNVLQREPAVLDTMESAKKDTQPR